MTTIRVAVPGAEYDVRIERGSLESLGERLRDVTDSKSVALISDQTVADMYGVVVDSALARSDFDVAAFAIEPGEASKNWAKTGELLEGLAGMRRDRTTIVVALGGGVVGDMAGFVSAVYLRGVDFFQVPTTLLAAVDSSVGGKTGVDLAAGKNMAGAFKQPLGVLLDPAVLGTLPDSEWLSGLGEIAKVAVLAGEDFLGWLEGAAAGLRRRETGVVDEAIARAVEFKASVVTQDEKESGLRECLNYGHTFGHALEKVLGYGTISHGAAVAEGMRFASRVAVECAEADKVFVRRQDGLLDALGLGTLELHAEPAMLLDAMRSDKKVRADSIRFVLPSAPGEWHCEPVGGTTIAEHLEAWAATKRGA